MKKLMFFLFMLVALSVGAYAQAPQGIPYQAVARNSSGAILASTAISVRFTIRDSVATGTIQYRETNSVTTSAQGMFSLNVGQGTVISGTFQDINWGSNSKFMQVEIDPAGGASYIDMGTTQMMSVPYALHSGSLKMRVSTTGDTLFSGGGNFLIIPGISAANLSVGMSYGGGIIAYILQPGDPGYIAGETHGLIAAPSDQSSGIEWGCTATSVVGTSTALGTGSANTAIISATCGTGTAARLCADLELNGYSDWYLPSRYELEKLYINRSLIGGFTGGLYWSSSQFAEFSGWCLITAAGVSGSSAKNNPIYVRAVRSF